MEHQLDENLRFLRQTFVSVRHAQARQTKTAPGRQKAGTICDSHIFCRQCHRIINPDANHRIIGQHLWVGAVAGVVGKLMRRHLQLGATSESGV
jgi:hypothetical protein